jgi:hypothetical protein
VAVRGSVVLLTGDTLARAYDVHGAVSHVNLELAVEWLRQRDRTGVPRFI